MIPNKRTAIRGFLCIFFALSAGLVATGAQTLQDGTSTQTAKPESAAAGAPYRKVLDNGLEILVLEQPEADHVRMGIVFRAGATAQTAQTAGLFRLLELVLFRGNATDPGEPEPGGAVEALGAENISGGAKSDRFDFIFDIQSDRVAQGFDTLQSLFSDYRLETALADPAALEEARNAALLSLKEYSTGPDEVYEAAIVRKLFARAPWRFDTAGADYLIRAADGDKLRTLASTWLLPNNAVLIVAGDVDAAKIAVMAETAFGAWKRGSDPWKTAPAAFPKPGVTRPTWMTYPDPSVPQGQASVEMLYRGPDVASTAHYGAAILWEVLAASPTGRLSTAVQKGMPKAAQISTPTVRYRPSRDSSWFSLEFSFKLEGVSTTADRVLSLKEIVRGSEMYAMKTNLSYFSKAEYETARSSLHENRATALMDPARGITILADSWLAGGADQLVRWAERVDRTTSKEVAAFADEYFMRNLEVVALRINPADYAARKKTFDSYGFEQINAAKAFWWM